jgi:hypothetical protein
MSRQEDEAVTQFGFCGSSKACIEERLRNIERDFAFHEIP